MSRLPTQSKYLIVTLCLLLAVMRVSGAHLHYCLDGTEPPVSMHFDSDAGLHHLGERQADHHSSFEHSDVDVDIFGDTLSKKIDSATESLAVLVFFGVLLCLLPIARERFDARSVTTPVSLSRVYVPPLRGPPL